MNTLIEIWVAIEDEHNYAFGYSSANAVDNFTDEVGTITNTLQIICIKIDPTKPISLGSIKSVDDKGEF